LRAAFEPAEGVADKPTKRRESALLAGAIRGETWLGSEGKAFPTYIIISIILLKSCKMNKKYHKFSESLLYFAIFLNQSVLLVFSSKVK
jgi:hypothetical protein